MENQSTEAPVSSNGEGAWRGTAKILVIDDDPFVLAIAERKLASRGYHVIAAADGAAGLAAARANIPDLVLLDLALPVVDGWEVLQELRADPVFAAIPVIMLTARRNDGDVANALELGARDYIIKPFTLAELVARVERLLPAR